MKYKVGDKVKIKSLDWYSANKTKDGDIFEGQNRLKSIRFVREMTQYCSKIATIVKVEHDWYRLDIDGLYYLWQDYMFEDTIHLYAYRATDNVSHNKEIIQYLESLGGINDLKLDGKCNYSKYGSCYYIPISGNIRCCNEKTLEGKYIITNFKEQNIMWERIIKISLETAKEWYEKGGELKEVALQAYTEKELIELPKTWEGCYKQLERKEYISSISNILENNWLSSPTPENYNTLPFGLGKSFLALMQLLVCREVYRQGWKPDWNSSEPKYCISYINNDSIIAQPSSFTPELLSFQSKEIRDQFLANFRYLIEEARGLL